MHYQLSAAAVLFAFIEVGAVTGACEARSTPVSPASPSEAPASGGNHDASTATETGPISGNEAATLLDAGTIADVPCARDGCDAGIPLTVTLVARVSLEGQGCPAGSAPNLTAERIPLTKFDLHDSTGDATTLVKHCLVVHEMTIPEGYALTGGLLTAETMLKLPTLGRASVKLRSQVNDGPPEVSLIPYEGAHDETVELTSSWPDLDACHASRTFRVETLASATLRAERANTEPRRITVKELRFGQLVATRCPASP